MKPERPNAAPAGRGWSVVLLVVSLLFVLGLAEGIVRLLRPQSSIRVTPGLFAPDPPRHYALTPGYRGEITDRVEFRTTLVINGAGLRGPALAPPSADRYRLLVIGDSITFGWGVEGEEALPALLADQLAPVVPNLETLNGGVPGFGLPDEAAWLVAHGVGLRPDVVVVMIFMGNDLLDATAAHRAPVVTAEGGAGSGPGGLRGWLARNLHLIWFLKRSVPLGLQLRLRALVGLPEAWAVGYWRDMVQTYAETPTPLALEGREASRAALAQIADEAARRGFAIAGVLAPHRIQVDPARWQQVFAELDEDPAGHAPEVPARFFAGVLADLGVPCLDLTPSFRQATAEGAKLYFDYDQHWTAAGHRLAAGELAAFLRAEDLLATP